MRAWHRRSSCSRTAPRGNARSPVSCAEGVFSIVLAASDTPQDKAANPLEPVILDYRNRALVERILDSDAQKIYVTYGAEHIPGVLALLEAQPKSWKVLSAKWSRTLSAPREYAGRPLPGLLPTRE